MTGSMRPAWAGDGHVIAANVPILPRGLPVMDCVVEDCDGNRTPYPEWLANFLACRRLRRS